MTIKKALVFSLLIALVVAWTACGSDSKPPAVSSIAVVASSTAPAAGTTTQLSVTATYNNGSSTPVADVVCSSSNETVATIGSGGLVTTHAQGSAVITCRYGNFTSQVTIAVGAPVLSALSLSSTTVSIAHGLSHAFEPSGQMTDGSNAHEMSLTWTSSDPTVATVSNGVITTLKPGTTTITVSCGNISATATVTVLPPALKGLSVTPADSSLTAGSDQQFTLAATYTDNKTNNVTAAAIWTSSAPAIATVDAAGMVHAVAEGSTQISAKFDSDTAYTNLTVTSVPSNAVTFLYSTVWSATDQTHYLKTIEVAADGSMTETGSVAVSPSSGKFTTDGKRFIYLDSNIDLSLQVFRIDRARGTLTKTQDFKPAAGRLGYTTLDPTGKWLFAFDTESPGAITLRVFAIDQTSGALSDTGHSYPIGDFFLRASSQNVTAFLTNSSGTYFYWGGGSGTCIGYFDGSTPCRNLFGYGLDMATGALTPLPGNPFPSWSPQVQATAITPDGAAMWVSLDAYRIITYAIDPATGVPTEVERWWPTGSGMPIEHFVIYGDQFFAGQDAKLLRVTPAANHTLTQGTVKSITLPSYIFDVSLGNNNSMLFAAYMGSIASFTLDSEGMPVPAKTIAMPLPIQVVAIDRVIPQ